VAADMLASTVAAAAVVGVARRGPYCRPKLQRELRQWKLNRCLKKKFIEKIVTRLS